MAEATTLNERACAASRRYLEVMGYDVLAEHVTNEVQLVAKQDDKKMIHFVTVSCGTWDADTDMSAQLTRDEFERAIIAYCEGDDTTTGYELVHSHIELYILSQDRAIIRYMSCVPWNC